MAAGSRAAQASRCAEGGRRPDRGRRQRGADQPSASQAAILWQTTYVGAVGDLSWVMSVDPLAAGRASPVDTGLVYGTCGYREPLSPSLAGDVLFWARDSSPCSNAKSYFVSFNPSGVGTHSIAPSGGGFILSLARDGADTYWMRDDLPRPSNRYDAGRPVGTIASRTGATARSCGPPLCGCASGERSACVVVMVSESE